MEEIRQLLNKITQQVTILAYHIDKLHTHNSIGLARLSLITSSTKPSSISPPAPPPAPSPFSDNTLLDKDPTLISQSSNPYLLQPPKTALLSDQEISSFALTGATNPVPNTIPNDDLKLLSDEESPFPNTLEAVLATDPLHVYFTKIKNDDSFINFSCCLIVRFCNAFISSFLHKNRIGDEHNLFVKRNDQPMIFGKVFFVFDPDGIFSIESSDLEDKVVFEGMVMIEFGVDMHTNMDVSAHDDAMVTRPREVIKPPERFCHGSILNAVSGKCTRDMKYAN